jgi:hypothetical protein
MLNQGRLTQADDRRQQGGADCGPGVTGLAAPAWRPSG